MLRCLLVCLLCLSLGCRREPPADESSRPAAGSAASNAASGAARTTTVVVTGRVTDDEGARVAGANVALRVGSDNIAVDETNKDGSFRLTSKPLALPVDVWLRIRHEGHATRVEALRVTSPTVTTKPFRLAPQVEAEGRVLDRDGTPIAAAKVIALRSAGDWAPVSEASTDEEGRFVLPGLASGKYKLRIEAFGYRLRTQASLQAPARITLRLERTHVIQGHVLDDAGIAAGQARVLVVPVSAQPGGAVHVWNSDGTGKYAMDGFAPGVYLVWGQKADLVTYPPMKVSIEAEDPEPVSVDLSLAHKGAVVKGEVFDGEGRPVPDARVELRPRWPLALPVPMGAETEDAGSFSIGGLTPGRYEIAVWHGARPLSILDGPRAVQVSVEPGEVHPLEPIHVRLRAD